MEFCLVINLAMTSIGPPIFATGARHLVENYFVNATFHRIRQYVDAPYCRIPQFVDYDNPSKFRRKMSKFRQQLNLRTIQTMQLQIRLYSEFYEYPKCFRRSRCI